MFSISSRAPLSATPIFDDSVPTFRHRPQDEKLAMDIDDEYGAGSSGELGAAGRNIVGPGEGITSAKEYMRFVAPFHKETHGELIWEEVTGRMSRMSKSSPR
jgi:exosome complex component RRP4